MNEECAIWQTPAKRKPAQTLPFTSWIDSPRTGGEYLIDDDWVDFAQGHGERCKARLTSWLVDQRRLGNRCPEVTREKIEAARNAQDMRVSQRVDRVLQFLEARTRTPGEAVTIDPNPDVESHHAKVTVYYQLLAHSESIGWNDLKYLLDHLAERRMVRKLISSRHEYPYLLEVRGFERLDELKKVGPASDRVFIAMWFDDSLDAASESIKDAIEAAGYQAIRVDKQHYVGNIVDKIISEIRRSRFVVADFSQDDCARGGVYYEAGFARGLGLKVISTCRQADADQHKLHFDILQDNHILWETEDDLRVRLEERISAVMGDGPRKDM